MTWLKTALQVILLHQVADTRWTSCPLRYHDYPGYEDLYFDRIAALTLNISNRPGHILPGLEKINVAFGMWITSDRILTSYNPFRDILNNNTLLPKLISTAIKGRSLKDGEMYYIDSKKRLACGRQVQYLTDEQIFKDKLWDMHEQNCPLHDLMVFRIYGNHNVSNITTEENTMENLYPTENSTRSMDILLAEVATSDDLFGDTFKFAYLYGYYHIRVINYYPDDEGLLDCDEWIPREWGYFICIRNIVNDLLFFPSGAMLVCNEKLFGVGSFKLFRGQDSVLVFTDVRPYYDNIMNTCSYEDTKEKKPESFPYDEELSLL